MLRAIKIRLLPTKEQESLFWKSAGTARWAYNYFLAENEKIYTKWLNNNKTGQKSISEGEIRKHINNTLKKTTHTWLKEVGSNVMKQGIKDANRAMQRFYKGLSGKPKFKSRRKSKISFYVNYESLSRKRNGFHGEKIGYIKTKTHLPKIGKNKKYSNPHISFDGKNWYISIGYEVPEKQVELTNESIGIDLGIKELAIVANTDGTKVKIYPNINKTRKIKKLEKRLKREQRKTSRKIENNIKGYTAKRSPIWKRPLNKCKNIERQNQKIRLIYKRLNDIRNNYLHQTTTEIVKTKPFQIVMEDLNVKGIMKNRHISKAVSKQKFYEFKRQIEYKAKAYGIKLIEANRYYASSKTCNQCGNKKSDLKLKERTYQCACCGLSMNRDVNAAINLAKYKAI